MNKVLVSGLLSAAILSSAVMPAAAINIGEKYVNLSTGVAYEIKDLSVAGNVSIIKATVDAINQAKASGNVTDEQLVTLASQFFALDRIIADSGAGVTPDVVSVVNDAETAIAGLTNEEAQKAEAAIAVVKVLYAVEEPEPESEAEDTEVRETVYSSRDIGNLKGFSDLENHQWARQAIESMSIGSYRGLFSGTTPPNEQGMAQFSPDSPMTRAQFLAVVLRIVYPYKDLSPAAGEAWWHPVYNMAVDKYIIYDSTYDFTEEVLNAPIPRQEMASIILGVCQRMGAFKTSVKVVYEDKIPDYDTITSQYRYAVSAAVGEGFILGIDDRGTFAPHKSLTRAEAGMVLYRVVKATENAYEPITIYEGQARYNRNAKPGDIFVKKDGTQIVLQLDRFDILGGGQGVAADVGLFGYIGEQGHEVVTYDVRKYGVLTDSTGQGIQNGRYFVNQTTGEGYWVREYQVLEKHFPQPDREGAYDGEISPDPYCLYKWDADIRDWSLNVDKSFGGKR